VESALGHNEKNSQRAYVFRNALDSCLKQAVLALTFSARSRPSALGLCEMSRSRGFKAYTADALIRARTGEGRARAEAKGVKMGRPSKLTANQK